MISQFFILSPRGDTIISKDYRGDAVLGIGDIFFRKVKFWEGGDAPPVFNIDGTHFHHIKKQNMYLVATTMFNMSPSLVLDLLCRLGKIFKDYCGVLTEESIRKNFILIYELLDEVMDYGYPQATSTESLKAHVYNEPVVVEVARAPVASGISALRMPSFTLGSRGGAPAQRTAPSSSVQRPIAVGGARGASASGGKRKNEIFVDILERINVLFSATGSVVNSSIDGCIQMKSYLSGNPELSLALSENLMVGKQQRGGLGRGPCLDDVNFHEACRLEAFEEQRVITLLPPDGEFTLLNYRSTAEFRAPFRLFPQLEEVAGDPYKLELTLLVRADIPAVNYGANVVVSLPLPRCTASAQPQLGPASAGQSAEYSQSEKMLRWTVKKFTGGTEQTLRCRITLAQPVTSAIRREVGPVSMEFEIPMYNVSSLQVRHLRIANTHKGYNPYRWVRYVTQSSSYVNRL